MKKLLLVLTVVIAGCGTDPQSESLSSVLSANCGGSHVGDWGRLPGPSEILDLKADCSGVLHTGNNNQSAFTYAAISATQVRLNYTSGAEWTCSYEALPTTLRLNCGAGWVTYHAAY